MRNVELVTGHYYHIYNRGVDKRNIFLDRQDHSRFIHYLYEFNDFERVISTRRRLYSKDLPERGLASLSREDIKRVVDIVCFVLMDNHFHMILKQLVDNGISKFMNKLGTGHAMYFNKKNKRTGRLFEGPFKSKLIENDEYLMHLSRYIHLNPLDLIGQNWREEEVKDWDRANKYLEKFKWSSYPDYIDKHNFPNIINKETLSWYFKTPEDYKRYVQSWVTNDMDFIEELIME